MKCETCRFGHINWRKGDKFTYVGCEFDDPEQRQRQFTSVQCRRHAPTMSSYEYREDGWPNVSGDDWCGEHKPKENSDG